MKNKRKFLKDQEVFDSIEAAAEASKKVAVEVRKQVEDIILNDSEKPPMIKLALASRVIDQGQKKLATKYKGTFEEVIAQMQVNLALEFAIKFTQKDLNNLSQVASATMDEIKFNSLKMKADLKKLMLQNLGKGLSFRRLVQGLKDANPKYAQHAYTLANTSLLNLYKDATFSKISETFEHFKYVGPNDSVTRPYCQQHVGKVYTSEEAKVIHAHMMTLYNCRHTLRPITNAEFERLKLNSLIV